MPREPKECPIALTTNACATPASPQGADKYENEHLIRHALPLDVWFHVDALSSAHVYLRLPEGVGMEAIPAETLEDCLQLVKANSIQGNKQNNLQVVYTPASNLRKTAAMDVGQVGFHSQARVRKAPVARRLNEIVNRLNRTKEERQVDLEAERSMYDREQRGREKARLQDEERAEREAREEQRREKERLSYDRVMLEASMTTSKQMADAYENAEDYEASCGFFLGRGGLWVEGRRIPPSSGHVVMMCL